jgi:hypothetical protein
VGIVEIVGVVCAVFGNRTLDPFPFGHKPRRSVQGRVQPRDAPQRQAIEGNVYWAVIVFHV